MKFLLLAVVILLLAWRWRTARNATLGQRSQPKPPTKPAALSMVVCNHCGVHIPAPDAVQGAQGVYCSIAHRQHAET
jgi:uncharacterized protein